VEGLNIPAPNIGVLQREPKSKVSTKIRLANLEVGTHNSTGWIEKKIRDNLRHNNQKYG
jgi:hypothetical protein